ncbi:MAG: PilN domain-containing protein, partial [Usitatibacter sp.]
EAEATDALARTLERQVADYNFVQGKRHGPPALAYLEDVSRLLPDNTWVQQFDLRTAGKSREVQITGETVSSSKLIEILEQSTLLQNAAPRGTVTRGAQPGTERFMIAAEARARPLPQARPAQEVAALPPPPERVVAQPAAPTPPPIAAADNPPALTPAGVVPGAQAGVPPAAQAGAEPTSASPPTAKVELVRPAQLQPNSQAWQEAMVRKEAQRAERKAIMDARARDATQAREANKAAK